MLNVKYNIIDGIQVQGLILFMNLNFVLNAALFIFKYLTITNNLLDTI